MRGQRDRPRRVPGGSRTTRSPPTAPPPQVLKIVGGWVASRPVVVAPPCFKHPPFPAIGLLFLVVNEEEKWEESALCVAFATTVSYRTIIAVDSLKFHSQSCV